VSYDYPDGYVHPPRSRFPLRAWFVDRYWGFVIWAALDCRWRRANDWGLRRLDGSARPRRRTRCSTCGEPYARDPVGRALICSNGFHMCRDCTWVAGRLTKRCAHHAGTDALPGAGVP